MKKNILITLILIVSVTVSSFAQDYIIQVKSKKISYGGILTSKVNM